MGGWTALAMGLLPVGVERFDNGAYIAHGRTGRGGIAPIVDHLHVGRLVRQQPTLEIVGNVDHEYGAALIDKSLYIPYPAQGGHATEHTRSIQSCQQSRRSSAPILIEYGV